MFGNGSSVPQCPQNEASSKQNAAMLLENRSRTKVREVKLNGANSLQCLLARPPPQPPPQGAATILRLFKQLQRARVLRSVRPRRAAKGKMRNWSS
jgi:hypothetical protein